MKIALVCPYDMFERPGGVQQLIMHLQDGLIKKGHSVKIITPRPTAFKDDPPPNYILLGTTRSFSAGFGSAGNWGFPEDGDKIGEVLEREKFDVINFHEPIAPIITYQIINRSTAAHVGTFHANLVDTVAAKSWASVFQSHGRGIIQKMHVVTAVSPAPASLLINKATTKEDIEMASNIRYIPNGIDLATYKPPKKRLPLNGPDTKTIVYVGRLDRRKGVEWLIKAYAELVQEIPSAYLIIAGEGSQRDRLEQLVETLGLNNVKFAGFVDEIEKRRLLGNADVTCFPSLYGESFGIVLVEAMAMGAPVIGGNNLGYINVLKDYGRIGLVDPKSSEDFANRLAVFLTSPEIQNSFRHWVLGEVKKYDYPKIVDMYEAAYEEAMAKWRIERHINGTDKKNGKWTKKLANRLSVRRHS